MKPDLAGPAADMKGIGKANQDIDDVEVNSLIGRETPRQQRERE